MSLAPAPAGLLGPDGLPLCGRYQGALAPVDWSALAPPYARGALWRRFHHKRWHYVALASEQLFCAVAIVDVGWTSTAFAYAFERASGRMLADFSQDGWPGLSTRVAGHAGAASRFRTPRCRIAIDPDSAGAGVYALTLDCPGLSLEAQFGPAGSPLLAAVGPVAGGAVHATQKSSGLPLRGQVRTAQGSWRLDGGVASFDYSNGLLARETAWRWASGHSLELGFNLQAGYFGAAENALWLDGEIHALGAASFSYDAGDARAPWQLSTDDGLLELEFRPEGARAARRELLVAASRYVQPIGSFSGWVRSAPDRPRRSVVRLAGVTEDHASRW